MNPTTPDDRPYRACTTCEVTWRGTALTCWMCGGFSIPPAAAIRFSALLVGWRDKPGLAA